MRKTKIYRSCSGCFESEDGNPVGDYPMHKNHGCVIGYGCKECQGLVRDHMAEYYESMTNEEVTSSPSKRSTAIE